MNKTVPETRGFFKEFASLVKDAAGVDIVVAPAFTSLYAAAESVKGANIKIAAQDVFYEEKGAFTGEISPAMILDCGCSHVIIGHSERRQYFNDTDEVINRKIRAAKKNGLGVIFCVGESLAERESGKTFDVLNREIEKGLENIGGDNIVVAYEPIWAIGTGKTAAPSQAQEAHACIREKLRLLYGNKAAEIRIIYGGSVTTENVDSLMTCEDVDGALVGGASLQADSFARIVKFKTEAR